MTGRAKKGKVIAQELCTGPAAASEKKVAHLGDGGLFAPQRGLGDVAVGKAQEQQILAVSVTNIAPMQFEDDTRRVRWVSKAVAQCLTAQSPIANAGKLRRPLLMLAGGEDEHVPIRGVTHYTAKLKSLGKDVSLFIDAGASHSVDDTRTREAYYFLMETLLHHHLRGAAARPPDRALQLHIRRNLRLAGHDLQPLLEAHQR